MLFHEALPATISSHTCIVEYFDCPTTFCHDSYSPLCAATDSPANGYRFDSNFAITSFSFIFAVAYILYRCQKPRSRNFRSTAKCFGSVCLHSVVITVTIGLILTLLVLYELMLLVQVQIETGLKGIVLSLLPSFPLSALGWYVKKRSQRRSKTNFDATANSRGMLSMYVRMTLKTDSNDDGDSLLLPCSAAQRNLFLFCSGLARGA